MGVSVGLLAFCVVSTPVAIEQGWPAEFGGLGDPDDVADEWMTRGTLISPPLAPMVVQALLTPLALLRRPAWRTVAGLGLAIVGALYVVGGFGEPFEPVRSDPPVVLYAVLRFLGIAGGIALAVLGLVTALAAIRSRRGARQARGTHL